MRIIKQIVFLLLTISVISCGALLGGGTGVTKTSNQEFTPTEPSTIQIFFSEKPTKEYFEIGTVSVLRVKSPVFPTPRAAEKIKTEMKEKAASIGGNAIINYKESGEANMTGTIIRYK